MSTNDPMAITPFVIVLLPVAIVASGCLALAIALRRPPERAIGRSQRHGLVVVVAVISLLFVVSMQVPVHVTGPGIDGSFPHILNRHAFDGTLFGSELIYTYGPLGCLIYPELVDQNLLIASVFWPIAYLAFAVLLGTWITVLVRGWRLVAALVVAVIAVYFIDPERFMPCLAMLLAFVGYSLPAWRRRTIAIGCVIAAMAALMKMTGGALCVAVTAGSAAVPWHWQAVAQRFGILFAGTATALVAFWIALTGSVDGLAAYFANTLELVGAYTSAMPCGNRREALTLAAFLLAVGILAYVAWRLPRSLRMHAALSLTLPMFIAWKHGVVRLDGHVSGFVGACLCLFLMLYLSHEREHVTDRRVRWRLVALTGVLVLLDLGMRRSGLYWSRGLPFYVSPLGLIRPMSNQPLGINVLRKMRHWERFSKELQEAASAGLAGLQLSPAMLDEIGKDTVDVYSHELGFVAANALNFHLKPVFQHFNAFTSRLDRLHADFYAAPTRPKYLIYHSPGQMYGIDGRHILYDDPIAQMEIFNHYRPLPNERSAGVHPLALLKADGARRFADPIAAGQIIVRWREQVPVPPLGRTGAMRVRVAITTPPLRKLKEAAFRLAPTFLVYELDNGLSERFRLVPTHMQDGVWIAPYFSSLDSLLRFIGRQPFESPNVTTIRFESDNEADHAATITLTWERIEELR